MPTISFQKGRERIRLTTARNWEKAVRTGDLEADQMVDLDRGDGPMRVRAGDIAELSALFSRVPEPALGPAPKPSPGRADSRGIPEDPVPGIAAREQGSPSPRAVSPPPSSPPKTAPTPTFLPALHPQVPHPQVRAPSAVQGAPSGQPAPHAPFAPPPPGSAGPPGTAEPPPAAAARPPRGGGGAGRGGPGILILVIGAIVALGLGVLIAALSRTAPPKPPAAASETPQGLVDPDRGPQASSTTSPPAPPPPPPEASAAGAQPGSAESRAAPLPVNPGATPQPPPAAPAILPPVSGQPAPAAPNRVRPLPAAQSPGAPAPSAPAPAQEPSSQLHLPSASEAPPKEEAVIDAAADAIRATACNRSSGTLLISAIHMPLGERIMWRSSGYWRIDPGQCRTLFNTQNHVYYLHADRVVGSDITSAAPQAGEQKGCLVAGRPYSLTIPGHFLRCPDGAEISHFIMVRTDPNARASSYTFY